MRRVVIDEFLSIDGIAQAPGGADEDRDGGFEHGGWHMPYLDDISGKWITDGIVEAGGLVLGRRTYEVFAAYWPNAPKEEEPIATKLNELPKYVASTTLKEPLAWHNSTLLVGGIPEAVAALRQGDGKDLHVIGSTRLVQTLIEHGLVDEFRLMIDPILLGGGKRIFPDDHAFRSMRLVDSRVTSTGAILARYVAT